MRVVLVVVQYFLKQGDDPNQWDRNGVRPTHAAAGNFNGGGILQVGMDMLVCPIKSWIVGLMN